MKRALERLMGSCCLCGLNLELKESEDKLGSYRHLCVCPSMSPHLTAANF
jgi:hypothetical protein